MRQPAPAAAPNAACATPVFRAQNGWRSSRFDAKRKRGELLAATEKELTPIAAATRRQKRPLRGKDKIALRIGKVINHYKMAKHYTLEITDESFTFTRNKDSIAAEAALDGIYVLRTSLPKDSLPTDDVVARYKNLADVERFFRTLNSELDVRPIRHRLADRVRAHMFLRMLSYHLSWHMKQALAPILFIDNDKPAAAAAKRANPVGPAQRSDEALHKAARKPTAHDTPVHSFTSLLADLATICANQIQPNDHMPAFTRELRSSRGLAGFFGSDELQRKLCLLFDADQAGRGKQVDEGVRVEHREPDRTGTDGQGAPNRSRLADTAGEDLGVSFDLRLGPLRSVSSPATPASLHRVSQRRSVAGFTANAAATCRWVAALIRVSDTAANRRPAASPASQA